VRPSEGERRPRLRSLLLTAVFALAVAAPAAAADFYAYYTKLDYTQPPPPDWLGLIPVNAANMFSDGRPDPADAGHGGSARVDPLKALGSVDFPMGKFWPPEVLGGQESRQRC